MSKLIPWGLKIGGVLAAAGGTLLASRGAHAMALADQRATQADREYQEVYQELKIHEDQVNDSLWKLGEWQEYALIVVVERMIDFLQRHDKLVAETAKLLTEGMEPTPTRVVIPRFQKSDPITWAQLLIGSAALGVGTKAGVTKLVKQLANASTGTPIRSLSGAAETRTILSALGGGSVASGGGGMASGKVALAAVTVGPAILVTGLGVAVQGEHAKTRAAKIEKEAHIAIAELESKRVVFSALIARSFELWKILESLTSRAIVALNLLESESFDPETHAARFQQSLQLALSVKDVATAPIVDEAGEVSKEYSDLRIRYRHFSKEPGND